MIDLTAPLPHEIRCDGGWAEVETDFRVWLTFARLLREKVIWSGVLKDPQSQVEGWAEGALEFFRSENPVPRKDSKGERVLDYDADSDLIVGAFMQAYGVDLTACEMHWHVFLALMRSLPDDTRLVQVMGYRSWEPTKKKHEAVYRELKEKWALPMDEAEEADLLAAQMQMFGGLYA